MATAEATETATEFDDATKQLGDQLVGLTLLQAKAVSDYLKEVHGIEPASDHLADLRAAGCVAHAISSAAVGSSAWR